MVDDFPLLTAVDTVWSLFRAKHCDVDGADSRRCLLERHLLWPLLQLQPLDTERNGAAGDDDGRAALGNGRQIVAEARELLSVQRWGACFPGRPGEHRRADLDHRPSAARERGAEGVGHQARLSKCSKGSRVLHTRLQ